MTSSEIINRGKMLLDKSMGRQQQFSSFGRVYAMTTENIAGYYKYFDFEDKDILTVCSSGDHILCALLEGAKKVDAFDINLLTEYYFYFKKALIEVTDFKLFQKTLIFSLMNGEMIDARLYEKMSGAMKAEYRLFWDEMVAHSLSNNLPLNNMFFMQSIGFECYEKLVSYLSNEQFGILKDSLDGADVGFIHSDLAKLPGKLDEQYDYMFCSNISDYMGIEETRKIAKLSLSPFLKDEGEIAYAYMYSASKKVANRYTRQFPKTNFLECPSVIRENSEPDMVLTFKK